MSATIGVGRSARDLCRWACAAAMVAAIFVWLAYPAMSQGRGGATHFCGITQNGDGLELEAGNARHPTSCGFARATYRAYRKGGHSHDAEQSHFHLRVAGRRLSCNQGVREAEVGESVFVIRCHSKTKFVQMSSEL
jgi:hypothetical protein